MTIPENLALFDKKLGSAFDVNIVVSYFLEDNRAIF